MIELTLPYPPSTNRYWRHVTINRAGRTLISKAGRQYRKAVTDACLAVGCPRAGAGRLRVDIAAFPPDRRRRDLDNILKGLLDAITHAGVWEDDSQIDELRVVRGFPDTRNGGSVLVEIRTDGKDAR